MQRVIEGVGDERESQSLTVFLVGEKKRKKKRNTGDYGKTQKLVFFKDLLSQSIETFYEITHKEREPLGIQTHNNVCAGAMEEKSVREEMMEADHD